MELLAKTFDVSPTYIMDWNKEKLEGVKIPVLGTVAADIPIEAIENIEITRK